MNKLYYDCENTPLVLTKLIYNNIKNFKELPVIMCVGTNKVVCDSVGPLAGTLLRHKYRALAYVYGTLEKPLNALNINTAYEFIKGVHPLSQIILVDASISSDETGIIKISSASHTQFLNKNIYCYADLYITVNTESSTLNFLLKKTKTDFIGAISDVVALSINNALFLKNLNTYN